MFKIPIPELPAYDSSRALLERPGHARDQDRDEFAPLPPVGGGAGTSLGKAADPQLVEAAITQLFKEPSRAAKTKERSTRSTRRLRLSRQDDYDFDYDNDHIAGDSAIKRSDYYARGGDRDRNRDRASHGHGRDADTLRILDPNALRHPRAGPGPEKKKDEVVLCCPCENPCPEDMAKDCLYVTTMFMNILYATVCTVFLIALSATQFPENEPLAKAVEWLTIIVAFACLVCFLADSIICCRLDIHGFMDQCPLIFWIACTSLFLALNLAQLFCSIVLYIQFEHSGRAVAIRDHHHPNQNSDALRNYGQDAFAPSLTGLVGFGFPFFILRVWFVCVVNHTRRLVAREYAEMEAHAKAAAGAAMATQSESV